ncbi:MAG: 2-amino-4-hydroxy-6-hydroxymethyldihydropteridine diphosphokinase [Dokdonella sp.]
MSDSISEVRAWIGLGGNLAESPRTLHAVLAELGEVPGCRLLRHSSFYRTAPWGMQDQPDFINAVAELATRLSAVELLQQLLAIEQRHGRQRSGPRWGPRLIDLDLLTYGESKITLDGLQVPHPRIAERAFVLLPLVELAPQLEIPGHGRVIDLLKALDDSGCVRL